MIRLEDRLTTVKNIEQARRAGARLKSACRIARIDPRTLQRWQNGEGLKAGDGRPHAVRPVSAHALSERERQRIVEVANEPRFAELPPARIVPMLADEGTYIASESSFSYLYLILDVYSRKIVGFEVHQHDDSDHAVNLLRRTALAEGLHALAQKPVLHGDNGSTLKATTVLAMMHWLGLRASYSRPRVSDDNAFVESLFRTAKYRPEFPVKGFADLQEARLWASSFVRWYNNDHRHSGIRYVSPAQRHADQDRQILAARHELYVQAKAAHPRRWARHTRNWNPITVVTLNPERESLVTAAVTAEKESAKAA
jgi:putative transposase